tara:strand:- start:245 stop:2509 length:2265 start_codon:yes stop_codon:yes gene_type:complete
MAIKLYKSRVNVTEQSSSVPTAKLEGNFGQAVFEGQQQLLDTTMQIEEKHRQIQEDKDVLKYETEYSENMNEIVLNHNKLNNYDEGLMSYDTATNELSKNITSEIKNKNVKRRIDNYMNELNSSYRIDVAKNIRTNSIQIYKDQQILNKNQKFNQAFTGNAALKTKILNEMLEGENSFYNTAVKTGTIAPGVTRESFNNNLLNEYNTAEAKFLINTNLEQFFVNDKNKKYNNLDFKTLSDLRSSAKGAKSSNNSSYISGVKKEANIIKNEIDSAVAFAEKDTQPNEESVNYLKTRAKELNQILIDNGEVGIGKSIDKLENSMFVYENMSLIKKLPLSGVQAKLNEVIKAQKELENQGNPNMALILLGEEIEKHIDFRETNQEGNLLEVGTNIGISDDGKAFTIDPIDFRDVKIDAVQTRRDNAERVANQLNMPNAEYFFKSERNQFKNIIETGSEDDIKNAILTVTEVAGEKSYLAFGEMSEASNAISQLGILYKHTGFDIDPAIRAFSLRNDESTQKILSQYNTSSNVELTNIKEQALQIYKMSPTFNNVKHYRMMSSAADLIFQGMILNNPEFNQLYDKGDIPIDDAAEIMKDAVNIAVGFDGQYGGLEEYNGHMIIVPSRFPDRDGNLTKMGHKNSEFGRGKQSLEELLDSDKMTDDLLARAVSSMPVLPKGLERKKVNARSFEIDFEYVPREATVKDLFDQKRVHLVNKGHGKYIFVFGDDPRTSDAKLRDADGQVVTFDLAKIYNDLIR